MNTVRRSSRLAKASMASAKDGSKVVPVKKTSVAKVKIVKKKKAIITEEKVIKEIKEIKAAPHCLTHKVVTVEACKSWGAFKSRAAKIQKGVGSKAVVEVNKEKPGKGNFVIKVSGTEEPIVELLSIKRPFPSLKALDMDDVIKRILEAVEG